MKPLLCYLSKQNNATAGQDHPLSGGDNENPAASPPGAITTKAMLLSPIIGLSKDPVQLDACHISLFSSLQRNFEKVVRTEMPLSALFTTIVTPRCSTLLCYNSLLTG